MKNKLTLFTRRARKISSAVILTITLLLLSFVTKAQTSHDYAVADISTLIADIKSGAYDIYQLTESGGVYVFTKDVTPVASLTIRAASGLAAKPVLQVSTNSTSTTSSFISPNTPGVTIQLEGLEINGVNADAVGNQTMFIRAKTGSSNIKVIVRDCYFHDFHCPSNNGIIRLDDGVDGSIDVQGSVFDKCEGRLLYFSLAPAVYGDFICKNNTFSNITGQSYIVYYKSASPSVAVGNNATIDHCTFYNCQIAETLFKFRNMSGLISITNCVFDQVAMGFSFTNPDLAAPEQVIDHCYLNGFESPPSGTNTLLTPPVFADAANLNFAISNFDVFAGSDNVIAGDPRYYTTAAAATGLVGMGTTHVKMIFSGPMDPTTAGTAANYALSLNGAAAVQPLGASLGGPNSNEVTLTIDDISALTLGQTLVVTASNLLDANAQALTGNNVSTLTIASALLSDLKVDGVTVAGFDKAVMTYNIVLPYGSTEIPALSYTTEGNYASVSVFDAAALPGASTLTVNSTDGINQAFYTVNLRTETLKDYAVADIATLIADIKSGAYDIFQLTESGGEYILTKDIAPALSLTIRAASGLAAKPVLRVNASTTGTTTGFFAPVLPNLVWKFEGIEINGINTNAGSNQTLFIRAKAGTVNMDVIFRDCYIHDFVTPSNNGLVRFDDVNGFFDVQGTVIDKCEGRLFYFNGAPGATRDFICKNNTFSNITGQSYVVYYKSLNSGADLAIGNNATIDHCTFYNCPVAEEIFKFRSMTGQISITNNVFEQVAGGFSFVNPNLEAPAPIIDHCYLAGFGTPPEGTNTLNTAPVFKDAAGGDFAITNFDALMGSDGIVAGDPRYYMTVEASTGLSAVDFTTVKMMFTSAIDKTAAETMANYAVSINGAGAVEPSAASLGSGDKAVTLTIPDISGLAIGETVVVTGSNLLDALSQPITGNTVSTLTIASALLTDLQVGGVSIEGFDKATLLYDVILAAGDTVVPTLTYTRENAFASVAIENAASLPGTSTVTVTSPDMLHQAVYSVNFTFSGVSSDATLSDLQVGGATVAGFSADVVSYDVVLPKGTASAPAVTATTSHANASAVVADAAALPGSASVTVTAEDGVTTLTYTVNFTVDPGSSDAALSDLMVAGTSVAGFASGTYTYPVVLAAGTTVVPTVTYMVNDANASAVVTPAASLPGNTTVVVTAEDGSTTLTYTVEFTVAVGIANVHNNGFVLYPNPAASQINLRSSAERMGQVYSIVSIEGKMLAKGKIMQSEQVIDISKLPSGHYLFVIDRSNVHMKFEKK